MPTYEYRCTACGEHIEAVQSFNDDPLTECGLCGGALRKVFSPVGIVFKGSGFYKTDSRGGKNGVRAGSSKDGSSKDGSSKDGSSKDGSSKDSGSKESHSSGTGTGSSGATPSSKIA